MTPNQIQFSSNDSTWVMKITADKRIEVNEDVEVTEAAQKVLDAMQHLLGPPAAQRQWVGLTDEEINTAASCQSWRPFARAIEAKLKAKNFA